MAKEVEELSTGKLLVMPGGGLAMGAVWMTVPTRQGCRGRDVQWHQGSFHGVRSNVCQSGEH